MNYKSIILLLAVFLSLSFVSAFELQKSLVQLEVDPNYPCHIEAGDTIVCNSITEQTKNDWIKAIDDIPKQIDDGKGKQIANPEKDKGKLTDEVKKQYISSNIIPYEGKISKTIDITKEYREKVNVYTLGEDTIKIGFATNVFGVAGTPLENFDVNSTTGMVRYRPLNMTWLNLSYSGSGVDVNYGADTLHNYIGKNVTISIWFNFPSIIATSPYYRYLFKSGSVFIHFNNGTAGNEKLLCFRQTGSNSNQTCSTSDLTAGQWYNVVGEWDGTNCSLYLNGVLNSTTLCQTAPSTTGTTYLSGTDSASWVGLVDEFRLYNRTLSTAEILQIYNSGRIANISLTNTSLNLWSSFNEKTGNIIYDKSRYSNNGTSTTTAYWQSDGINVTTLGYQVNISIVNITNAYIRWDNGTEIYPRDVNGNGNFTGNVTFSFLNNQTIWIYENFVTDLYITYNYTYADTISGIYINGTGQIQTGLIGMVVNFFSLAPIIGTILGVCILVAGILILIVYVIKMKNNNPSSFSG